MPPPDPVPPEGETLAHFAVVLAAHRGQLAALDGKVEHLAETVRTLAEGGPKGPPMIAGTTSTAARRPPRSARTRPSGRTRCCSRSTRAPGTVSATAGYPTRTR